MLGADAMTEFRQGMGNFQSTENPFFVDKVAMVQQGPWMSNFIHNFVPWWNDPRLKGLDPNSPEFKKIDEAFMKLPVEVRREKASWGVAPFPSVFSQEIVDSGLKGKALEDALVDRGVAFCDFDVLVIPQTARHKKEAFTFMAYLNQQPIMEQICAMHNKNSPLTTQSPDFFKKHPNPYIELFDRMASSPNSRALPSIPIWPEVNAELTNAIQRVALLKQEPRDAMEQSQKILQAKLKQYFDRLSQHEPQ